MGDETLCLRRSNNWNEDFSWRVCEDVCVHPFLWLTLTSVRLCVFFQLTGLSVPVVSSSLHALSFLFRLFLSHSVEVDSALTLLAKETDLNEEKRNILQSIWSNRNVIAAASPSSSLESATASVARTLSLGKLIRFSWRIGVGIASNTCAQLQAPFVTLAFEISNTKATTNNNVGHTNNVDDRLTENGTKVYLVECTHHEFQEVRKQFQEIFGQLDSI